MNDTEYVPYETKVLDIRADFIGDDGSLKEMDFL